MRGWSGTEGLTGRHRGRPLRWVLGTHFLLLSALVSTPATPQSLRDSSPRRGAKGAVQPLCTIPKSLPRSAALFRVVQRRRGETVARWRRRGRQTRYIANRYKKGLCQDYSPIQNTPRFSSGGVPYYCLFGASPTANHSSLLRRSRMTPAPMQAMEANIAAAYRAILLLSPVATTGLYSVHTPV